MIEDIPLEHTAVLVKFWNAMYGFIYIVMYFQENKLFFSHWYQNIVVFAQ